LCAMTLLHSCSMPLEVHLEASSAIHAAAQGYWLSSHACVHICIMSNRAEVKGGFLACLKATITS